jgi:subtilisin family serine protease
MRVVVGVVRVIVLVCALGGVAAADVAPRPGSTISVDIVACDLACGIARTVVPDAWIEPKRELVFDGVDASFSLGELVVTAHGDVSGNSAPTKLVKLGTPTIVGGSAYVPVTIDEKIQRESLDPDHYVGVVRIAVSHKVKGANNTDEQRVATFDVPFDLRARSGPVAPFLCVILGLLLGLLRSWYAASGQRASAALERIGVIDATVASASRQTRAVITPMTSELVDLVTAGRLDAFDAEVVKVEQRRDRLLATDRYARVLGERARDHVARIRELITLRLDDKAATVLADLEVMATTAGPVAFSATAKSTTLQETKPARPTLRQRMKLFAIRNAGLVLRVVTLVLFAFLGLKALYVDGSIDFGAQPLYDYLALILWGLGAELSIDKVGAMLGARIQPRQRPIEPAEKEDVPAKEPASPGVKLPQHTIKPRDGETPFSSSGWPHRQLDIDHLRDKGLTGKGTTIAVIDTGVARGQSKLDHDRITQLDIDAGGSGEDHHGHGTSMIGLVASRLGICKETKILSIRALDANGKGTSADLVRGIDLAIAKGADVISISAGQPEQDSALDAAVANAIAKGIVVVGAIRHEAPHAKAYPAACDGAVAVTPSTVDDELEFKNPPVWVDCGAPGVEVPTYGRNGEVTITGSSPAAALVAGVCSLLLSGKTGAERRDLAKRLAKIIVDTGTPVDGGKLLAAKKAADNI